MEAGSARPGDDRLLGLELGERVRQTLGADVDGDALAIEQVKRRRSLGSLGQIAQEARKRRSYEEKTKIEEAGREAERRNAAEKAKEEAALRAAWETLTPQEQEEIRQTVLANQPPSLAKHTVLVNRLCLTELAKRFAS